MKNMKLVLFAAIIMMSAFSAKAQTKSDTTNTTKQDNAKVKVNEPNLFVYYHLTPSGWQGVAGTGLKFSERVSDTTDNTPVVVGASDLGAQYYIKPL